MTFTKEQIEILSKYEGHFRRAVVSRWYQHPGYFALQEIVTIYKSATGSKENFDTGCGVCILNLLTSCGKVYFADKEELDSVKVSTTDADDIPGGFRAKVKVGTKKRTKKA